MRPTARSRRERSRRARLRPATIHRASAARRSAFAALAPILLLACPAPDARPGNVATARADSGAPAPASPVSPSPAAIVSEAFLTARDASLDLDSPAAWRAPDGSVLLLVTAKRGDVVLAFDGATGERRGRLGRPGTGPGGLRRPNGIATWRDVALVVERDNHRVQAFALPSARPMGVFGASELVSPYGITLVERDSVTADVWVTDNFELPRERGSRAMAFAQRVKRFVVSRAGPLVGGRLAGTVGDTGAAGQLLRVESIMADAENGRVLIADEAARDIKVYDLDGRFTGRILGQGLFRTEPEGIAVARCDATGTSGWIVATDQDRVRNVFHLFDRETLAHVGAFRGRVVRNTDGIWMLDGPVRSMPRGVLYALHDDGNVAAFDWSAVLRTAGVRDVCGAGNTR